MIGRQRTTPCKAVRFGGFPWIKVDARHALSTSIVDRVTELDGAPRAVGRDMNACRIDDNDGSTAAHPLNGCRTHRHSNLRDLKR